MKFKLEIELGNDAMQSNVDIETALQAVARNYHKAGLAKPDTGRIFDGNGNAVGKWEVLEGMTQETADFFNQKHAYGIVVNGVERDPADFFPPRQVNVNRLPYNPGPLYIQEHHE